MFIFCTLPQIRLPLIQAGVDAGVQLIAFEKPVALSMNEGLAMFDLLRKSGVKSVVSHQHRYGVHYQKVKEIISSGALGRVHTVYAHATGWMMHMMSHLVDYANWYNDYSPVEWVVGQAAGKEKFTDLHSSPDYIAALVQYANGVRGVIECGAGAPDVPEVEAWWRKCRIGAQGTEGFAEVLTGGGWRAVTKNGVSSGDRQHGLRPRYAALHPGYRRLAGRSRQSTSMQRREGLRGSRGDDGCLPFGGAARQGNPAARPWRTGAGSAAAGITRMKE